MLRNFLFLIASLTTVHCFSQPADNKDSSLKTTVLQNQLKDMQPVLASNATLKIYPNPAKNKIAIEVAGFEPGMAVVKITDTKGKVWRADNRLLINGSEEMAMFLLLQPGIYFIAVSQKNKVVRKKLVIL